MLKKSRKRRENNMSYLHNKNRKIERLIKRIKDTVTIENMKNLNPENKEDKKILDAIRTYNITLKIK
jgi:proteasome assembly chaperone (PAC2) family protein